MLTEQQKLAVETVDKNVLVSAGAGSGKTHVLVERYVEILRKNQDIGLGGIIAVTFTRKAAAEMRSRLKARFLALSSDKVERAAGNTELWKHCLAEVDSARINTINSLCESILKTFPADSGIDPEFEMLDDLLAAEMRQAAVDHAVRSSINNAITAGETKSESSPAYDLLLEFPLGELGEILLKLLEQSIQFEEALGFFPERTVDSMLTIGKDFLKRIKTDALHKFGHDRDNIAAMHYIENNPPSDPKNALVPVQQGIVGYWLEITNNSGDEESFNRRWQAMAEICRFDLRSGGNKPDIKNLKEYIKVVRESAKSLSGKIPAALDEKDARAMRCCIGMIELYDLAKKHYKEAKDQRNALDYGDQIALASAALRKPNSAAREYFTERTRALLIDEFQDTNDIQAKLLMLLAGEQTRIFLIGDDKQSIYKFQGADVSTFNRWRQRLSPSLDGANAVSVESGEFQLRGESDVSKLTMSFRSHPLVVHFVNTLFAGLLDGDPTKLDYVAAFEALDPARKQPAHELAAAGTEEELAFLATDVILFDEDDEAFAPAVKIEAAHVALWIKDKVDNKFLIEAKGGITRPLEYGDFAVLFNRNTDFAAFEEIFARVDIPFVSFGGTGFLLRQETADFENLLRFLDNPQNSHALLAVLRSPLCPLTDDLIHRVVTEGENIDKNTPLWSKLTQANQRRVAGFESIMQAVRMLRTLLDYSSQLPLGELVQKTIELTRYDLTVLASGDGKQRSRNIWKIAQMARDNESLSCGAFADRLAAMREMRLKQGEAPLDSRNAVKLMTIHASKGLEFPAVALPCLGGQLTMPGRRFTYHKSFGCAFNTKRSKDDEAPTWYQITSQLTKEMETEERKRLLYVAMTRARDCLGIFIRYSPRRETESYRRWLLDHLELRQAKGFNLPEAGVKLPQDIRKGTHEARFRVSHGFGMPPGLDMHIKEANNKNIADAELAAAVNNIAAGNAALDFEEPALTVFETPPNELALLRLTPKANASGSADDFAYLAPRVVGTFFHALMENLPLTKAVDREWVRDIAYNQGFHFVHPQRLDALVDEGMRLLDIYRGSKLAPLVESSHSRFNEMPYLIEDDFADADDPDNTNVMTMRPDMLIEAADGQWHLIDFKTDHFNVERIDHQALKHKRQLSRYVEDLQLMGNVSITPSLYFAQYGILYPLP